MILILKKKNRYWDAWFVLLLLQLVGIVLCIYCMVKEIRHEDKVFKVHVKDSTEPIQRDWSSGLFSNRSVLTFIKSVYKEGAIIEVGSGIGNNTLFFGGVLGAYVHTIEADAEKINRLRQNILMNEGIKTNLLSVAVSDYNGLARIERGRGMVYIKDKKDLADVSVTTVDSVVFDVIGLMYIDVTGNEFRVLSGCRRAIKCYHPELFIRTDEPQKVTEYIQTRYNVKYEVKYGFNQGKTIYYLKPVK